MGIYRFILLIQKNTVCISRRDCTLACTMLLLWLWNMPCTMMDLGLHSNPQMAPCSNLMDAHISPQQD